MKKLQILLFLAFVSILACKDDDSANPVSTVNLNFKALFGGEPLVFTLSSYTYPDGRAIKFQTLNFYISNVALLKEGGEEEIVDIEFLNFSENVTLPEAQTPLTVKNDRIPLGNYKGVRIGIGIPASMNKASANQLPAGHPLRRTYNTHFWSDWGSFIFMKMEGVYDKDGNGFDGNDPGFGHHLGTDAVYRTFTFDRPIEVKAGTPLDLNFSLDVRNLYVDGTTWLDLSNPANLYTHNPNDLSVAFYLIDNFQRAFVLE